MSAQVAKAATGLGLIAWRRHLPSLAGPAAFVLILAMVVVPLPPFILDFLFTFNISLALMTLLAALYTARSTDFSSFPTLLLITTLMRLSLNVAAARVILLDGYMGTGAAGRVIESFGDFVVGGDFAVGIAVFTILVLINFVVLTKGSGRIAEVAARFVLDGMPGKQMAIDADLNAGLIGQEEAIRRREQVTHEADFFGAMDGASKFVRGDAIAAILILFINMIGGLLIGVWQHGMDLSGAAANYALLTVGDGLVAQIPALVISAAAGVVVSRVSTGADIGRQVVEQFAAYPKVWLLGAGIVGLFGVIPGMPHLPFLTFAALLGGTGWYILRQRMVVAAAPKTTPPPEPEEIDVNVVEVVEPLAIEVGYRLVSLVSKERGGGLLPRLKGVRKLLSREFGFLVPAVHVRDNPDLRPIAYRILVHGVERAAAEVHPDRLLAIGADKATAQVPGTPTRDPAFGRPALWIAPSAADQARASGYAVFDAAVVVATHFERVLRDHVDEIFGRTEMDGVLAAFGKQAPKLVDELIPKLLSPATVYKVMRALLAERVPLRDLRSIITALLEDGAATQDAAKLVETVRLRLGRFIVQSAFGAVDEIRAAVLDGDLEKLLLQSLKLPAETGSAFAIEPSIAAQLRETAGALAMRWEAEGRPPAILVRPELRPLVAQTLMVVRPRLWVVSYAEIPPEKRIRVTEVIGRKAERSGDAAA
ncbi:MAG: flagellar biosynthesis protein FlhA [Alphaproteobacteria bacterium]|nr:flagellar biosynthesis protein FlhA [Alphaproteobacteria bacterium]MDE2512986.1 flagellar biosynthesis protein FlhA [Alphaproteobacteria bacterium]